LVNSHHIDFPTTSFTSWRFNMPRGQYPRKKKTTAAPVAAGQPRDLFKVGDIKEESLISTVAQRAGVTQDPEITGFIKSVIPRFSDWSANQGIRSISNMAKEFGKTGATGASNDTSMRAQADNGQIRRRPGRPKGSKNKVQGPSSERGQAAGEKRRPGRPRKSDR
jgi:hypothetical protein